MNVDEVVLLFYQNNEVDEHNLKKLHSMNHPILEKFAKHSGPYATKADSEDVGGLQQVASLSVGAKVMLQKKLWTEAGLVNGVTDSENVSESALPLAVIIHFNEHSYIGPTFLGLPQ